MADVQNRKCKRELLQTHNLGQVENAKMEIAVRCVEDLEKSLSSLETSMNKNAESADRLGNKVWWLNLVLAVASTAGVLLTAYQIFFSTKPTP